MKSKKAQVWVETVVYTLIAFAMIGLVLSFIKPNIDENKDKAILEQSVNIMNRINYKMNEIKDVQGNKRRLELSIEKGFLVIDGIEDRISFELEESNYKYSEPGTFVEDGDFVFYTMKKGKYYEVNITRDYNNYDLVFQGEDKVKRIHASPTKYFLFLSSKKNEDNGKMQINFEIN
ncbi:MAG TPA: hypothetical protein VJ912_02330 [Candidatus Nanoarchaeia archaeon]|nr:hypothetical protein [Candidatus Nanoarchaeia archaeon]